MTPFIKQINALIKTDKIERSVFSSVHAAVMDRIFEQGKAANRSQIGTYSPGYVKQRKRKRWGGSSKVILQFTGQMKNDFSFIKDGKNWGSGFKNNKNGDKSRWVEETYGKEIFTASPDEQNLASKLYDIELNKFIRRS